MPKTQTIIQIFVASPSDVSEERALLDNLVREHNSNWSKSTDIIFELIKWETDVRPGFSTEPQAVINSQVPEDYDVFLGIFWSRLGTPTKGSLSGSVEEFESALARKKKSGNSPEIMIYFKEAPVPFENIQGEQIVKLIKFKNDLSGLGGLYATFKDQSGFEASIRSHLSALAQHFSSTGTSAEIHTRELSTNPVEDTEDDLGYLDYVDIFTGRSKEMRQALNDISSLTDNYSTQINKRTSQIESAKNDGNRLRMFMRRSAEDFDKYSMDLDTKVKIYGGAQVDAFDALSKSVALHHEIGGADGSLSHLADLIKDLIEQVSQSKANIIRMRDTTNSIPRMIREVNVAKRKLANSLDRFIVEMDSTASTAANIVDSINKMQ